MAIPNYNCTQQELYTILQTGWNSCLKFQLNFVNFKPKYTPDFIQNKLKAIQDTKQIPDEQARNEASESARIILEQKGTLCLNKWQDLKRYIADAFPKELQKPKLEAAGQDYYLKASQQNWDSVNGLITSGMNFINDNLTALTAADNMPIDFQEQFKTLKLDFEKQHQIFLTAEEDETIGAEKKVNANNQIHEDGMKMLLDGQEIFKNEEAIQKQFIFAELLYLASGAGTAGAKGLVTDATTQLALPDINVSVSQNGKKTVTDGKGHYEITQMASGTYNFTFSGIGYQSKTITNFEVKVGTVSTLNVQLTATV